MTDQILKSESFWRIFAEISTIPRPSKHEEKIREYLINFARKNNFKYQTDSVGNVVIYVPGRNSTNGPYLIQSHMDMVCDKTLESNHDFFKDGIELSVRDGRVWANNTTLGADNGIGMALGLALAIDDKIDKCPSLELLFTVDEETGLGGALGLDVNLIKSKSMLNLDTEQWGKVYLGCAGGAQAELTKFMDKIKRPSGLNVFRLHLSGLKGGHSGVNIDDNRSSAIKELGKFLSTLDNLYIAQFDGGKAHNIIPREATALIATNLTQSEMKLEIDKYLSDAISRFSDHDKEIVFDFKESEVNEVYTKESSNQLLQIISKMPHGPKEYFVEGPFKGIVSLSSNLAKFQAMGEELFIETSYRSNFPGKESLIERELDAVSAEFDMTLVKLGDYPGWAPVEDSLFLTVAQIVAKDSLGHEFQPEIIHAGLECGVILSKIPDLDIISLGPNIYNPHSNTESLDIKSSNELWKYLKDLFSDLA